jgi:hypothetical protein
VAIIDTVVELNDKTHPPWRRLVAGAVGLAMFSAVFVLHPGPARGVIALGAVAFLWVSLAAARKRTAEPDAELLAMIHDRMAQQDELVVARLDRMLSNLRQD